MEADFHLGQLLIFPHPHQLHKRSIQYVEIIYRETKYNDNNNQLLPLLESMWLWIFCMIITITFSKFLNFSWRFNFKYCFTHSPDEDQKTYFIKREKNDHKTHTKFFQWFAGAIPTSTWRSRGRESVQLIK